MASNFHPPPHVRSFPTSTLPVLFPADSCVVSSAKSPKHIPRDIKTACHPSRRLRTWGERVPLLQGHKRSSNPQ
ncbi:hypothetical protein BV22DRAFT_1040734 [Leucogyrophana mollusca]|uniref:Uncharacterized protein n=1 Tax=Leucogyrophana mollusca TaxID=85980 RepID=A0ACB8B209_9AGAM|nr:hypothetical protein BV22DRAFT_1040734 [Leucogyrophana mollusca]